MPSTYTKNIGLEKVADGEQDGTWAGSVNTNMDLTDEAINGIISITLASAGTSGSPNALTITDGTSSDGRNAHIEYIDGGDLGADAYVQLDPNDAEKLVYFKNSLSGGRKLYVFQGIYSASRDYIINNGKTVKIGFSGVGAASSVATSIFQNLQVEGLGMGNATAIEWDNAAVDDVISIEVDASDDIICTVNSVVSLKFDSSATTWDFQATDITTSGDITGGNFSGTNTGDQTITLTGNVTGTGTGSFAATIATNAVTLAMMAHGTQGDIIYMDASGVPTYLAAGTAGQVLKTNGAGANPEWTNASDAGGDMTYGTASTTAGDTYHQSHTKLDPRPSGQEDIEIGEYESYFLRITGSNVTIDLNTASFVGTGVKLITGRIWVRMGGAYSGLSVTTDVTGAVIVGTAPSANNEEAKLVWEYHREPDNSELLWVQWINDA